MRASGVRRPPARRRRPARSATGRSTRTPSREPTVMSAKVFAHLGSTGTAGATKARQVPGILDRPQQAVVGLLHAGLKPGASEGRDHQGGDSSTGGVGAASGIGAPFIPRYEENAAVTEGSRVEDGGNLLAQPAVSGCD